MGFYLVFNEISMDLMWISWDFIELYFMGYTNKNGICHAG